MLPEYNHCKQDKTIYEQIRVNPNRGYLFECPCGYVSKIYFTKKTMSKGVKYHINHHCNHLSYCDLKKYVVYGKIKQNNFILFTYEQWYYFNLDPAYRKIIDSLLEIEK